jgi:site-specific recombinase XerD
VKDSLLDLAALVPSWQLALRSARKSKNTLTTYTSGVEDFLAWCDRSGVRAELTRPNVQQWIADMLDAGATASTATTRLGALKRFTAWLVDEDELPSNPLLRMPSPKQDTTVVPALTDDEVRLLIKSCHGKTFCDKRDEAIVRLMVETGLRANELVELRCDDLDLMNGTVVVRRGKGGKARVCPFGSQTATVLDRYVRVRKSHASPGNTQLFTGYHIATFTYWALAQTLRRRARQAGIAGFHVHRLRHTAATRWLRHGGSEGGLMAVAGWSNRQMLDRYTAATASERATAEARTLNLGFDL